MTTRSNSPFVPSFIRNSLKESKPLQLTYSDFNLSDSNIESQDSFKYDPLDYPLKSTQQLNLDWSKFENHTFFSSAEVKVNEAFNKIINSYPFDGTKKEVEEFLDLLTGYEKWVFDSFPVWSGALHFSGTQVGEIPSSTRGNWISVKDKSGTLYPDLAKNKTGEPVLNPGDNDSLSIEVLLFLPTITNDTQVVFQKSSTQFDGFTFYLEQSASSDTTNAVFCVASGSVRNSVSTVITKGKYNHICLILNKQDEREHSLQFYVNEKLESQSPNLLKISKINIDNASFLIGSGSSFYSGTTLVTPTQTLSGTLDELRLFHSVRDEKNQKLFSSMGLYSTPELKLYYRFNEPSGSLSINGNSSIDSIVLDSSGNSLHSNINNFNASLRVNAADDQSNLLVNERKEFQKILFPAYSDILNFNSQLLVSASNFDRSNPNNIIKLIPQHYLLEGASQDGFETIEGAGGDPYGGEGIPGQGKRGSVQIILSFLYIWAKFFDEIKLYIDTFVTLKTVSYDDEASIPDNFLEDMVRHYGFYLPKFFNNSTVEQFAEGQGIEGLTNFETPLKKIQSILVRRVLINMPDIIRSKGTQHSIRSFLRSVGIDPDNSLRIREYGGPSIKQISSAREKRIESSALVEFLTSSLVTTSPLSASRIEPGFPHPVGNFYLNDAGLNAGTDYQWDGLLTSGSWNTEAIFKVPPQKLASLTSSEGQSLFRMVVTGSNSTSQVGLVANVVATQRNEYPHQSAKIKAYIRPGMSITSPLLTLSLDMRGEGIFDGDLWNVSLGCSRNDEIDSIVSSSYYLRIGKCVSGDLSETYVTSSYFYEKQATEGNVFRTGSLGDNSSGVILSIGSNQNIPSGIGYLFLNNNLYVDDAARTTEFLGRAGNLRFWSKSMSTEEWKEHVRNPKSVGVSDPFINYNFTTQLSGSFQKLRMDTLQKQPEKNSDNAGKIQFLDFSQNNLTASGGGFNAGERVLVGEILNYSYLSPFFDEAATEDKIRIRSFESNDLLEENPWSLPAPSYLSNERFLQEEPNDDLRLSIEFSMIDSLDKDIVSMFSSFDILNNALGSPELMFSPDYPDLERLRDVYFNRLSAKPDFRKFLEFYKWFDVSISSFIEQLIPSKTVYKGTNYVVESHMLERHKNMYRHSDNYLGDRQIIEDSLLVQQIVGKLKKY
jgi:hypothetical protein